ncbi:MAG: ABC transporter permease, partial [Candidatus Hydrogenedentes bacterium]|nr:ABC transporter permease [Candidatus Hydrogenedentota bacterium]
SMHGSIEISEELREFDHADRPFVVVGILETSGTPFDRAIYCDIESIWDAHGAGHGEEHSDEGAEELDWSNSVSAILVQLHSPGQRFEYEGWINENTDAMAVVPIQVISDFFQDFLDPIKGLMMGVGYLVVVISALSILIGLYLSIMQRKRDLAIMRALGASSYEIFGAVIIEAFWVTTLGIAVGWLFGNAVTYLLGLILAQEYGLVITPFGLSSEEIRAFATVALVGLVAGILPAWQAYNGDVAHDLADRQ